MSVRWGAISIDLLQRQCLPNTGVMVSIAAAHGGSADTHKGEERGELGREVTLGHGGSKGRGSSVSTRALEGFVRTVLNEN